MNPIRVVAFVEAASITGPAGNLLRFCEVARQKGQIDLSVAAFHRSGSESSNSFFEAVRNAGIGLDIIQEKGRFDRSVVPAMREIAERRRADIVQSHAVKSHFLARYGGLQKRHRWIAFHHGYTAEDFKMRMYCKLDRWSLRAANRVVTVCVPFADDLVRQGVRREDIDIVPNSVLPAPEVAEADIRLPDDSKIVVAVGRFSNEKAHSDLLEAVAILRKDDPNTRVVLIGDGIERPNLEARAALPDLAGNVVFAGHQRNIWPYYALADLFVLPSLSEGSPNVLLEAMSAGVPIVATAVGGVPEIIENESTGLLVPPRNPAALAAAMRRLLSSPDLGARFTANALSRIEKSFSPESRYASLVRIYERVMGAK